MTENANKSSVPEDPPRLVTLERGENGVNIDFIKESLQKDLVALVKDLSAEQADTVMHLVAEKFNLGEELYLQAGFAEFLGHRHNVGKYFMSVNKRNDYQFISPHCEGSSFAGMQIAAFYCYENTTDGGETILLNIDDSSKVWPSLRERKMRGKFNRVLERQEIVRAKALYQVNLPDDVLRNDDQILHERQTVIPGLTVLEVLAKPEKVFSKVLHRRLYGLWDTIELIDLDSAVEYLGLLRESGLLKEPPGGLELRQLDAAADQRIWHSGARYVEIFKCKITRKLTAGDLVIQNNITWAHSVNNWSPGSGTRKVVAAFA